MASVTDPDHRSSRSTRRQRVVLGAPLDLRAAGWGGAAVLVVLVGVFLGSGGLQWFDAALAGYLIGVLLAVFATVYRYLVWLQRPPTERLNQRGWESFRMSGRRGRNAVGLIGLVVTNLLTQGFIRRRSTARWAAHQLVFWGCILAAAVTFPLTFGWLHFESVGQGGGRYRAFLFGVGTASFEATSVFGFVTFHLLNIAAFLVIAGVLVFLYRRLRDPGALAVEREGDFLALAGLFAVSVTGLFLTASSLWLEGRYYSFLNNLHALTVILGLLYIPFGKLFHIFQRPANLGVHYYRDAGARGDQQHCRRCGTEYASAMQVNDLKEVLPMVGFDYSSPSGNWQDTCPACRRASVTLAQTARVGGFG
ncbi:MAG: MFS transporter [Actinomycetota bacterium]|nr:MFS transporter [Actinomycetota bacterium]